MNLTTELKIDLNKIPPTFVSAKLEFDDPDELVTLYGPLDYYSVELIIIDELYIKLSLYDKVLAFLLRLPRSNIISVLN